MQQLSHYVHLPSMTAPPVQCTPVMIAPWIGSTLPRVRTTFQPGWGFGGVLWTRRDIALCIAAPGMDREYPRELLSPSLRWPMAPDRSYDHQGEGPTTKNLCLTRDGLGGYADGVFAVPPAVAPGMCLGLTGETRPSSRLSASFIPSFPPRGKDPAWGDRDKRQEWVATPLLWSGP